MHPFRIFMHCERIDKMLTHSKELINEHGSKIIHRYYISIKYLTQSYVPTLELQVGKVKERWEQTTWAKKLVAKKRRANLSGKKYIQIHR